MIKKTLLFIISFSLGLSYAQVGVNTEDPQATLHIEGDLIISNTSPKSNDNSTLKPLFVDPDGNVVRSVTTQAVSPILVIQTNREVISSSSTPNILTAFNSGTAQSFAFTPSDITINNLGGSIQNGYIRIAETGIYQINSLINYLFGSAASGNNIFISITLQKSTNNGSTWSNVVGYRPIFTINWPAGQGNPAILPTAITPLSAGNLLRYSFERTRSGPTYQGNELTNLAITPLYSTPSLSISIVKI